MRPLILIVEPRAEVAQALQDVVASANFDTVVRPFVDRLSDFEVAPAAILVRGAFEGIGEPPHASVARLAGRPPVVAIVWEDREASEAARLECDVVLRAPQDVGRLCAALLRVVQVSS